jgi:hypothetical protein
MAITIDLTQALRSKSASIIGQRSTGFSMSTSDRVRIHELIRAIELFEKFE